MVVIEGHVVFSKRYDLCQGDKELEQELEIYNQESREDEKEGEEDDEEANSTGKEKQVTFQAMLKRLKGKGWEINETPRKGGVRKGIVDRKFTSPCGKEFRSAKKALRFFWSQVRID